MLVLLTLPAAIVSDGAGIYIANPQQRLDAAPKVWLVEEKPEYDLYSNGLRVEKQYQVSGGELMHFSWFRRGAMSVEYASRPMGLVFHTTESDALPFEEREVGRLRRVGAGVVRFVRQQRAYHYVIDRFGRVWRIVPDWEAANHAGNSVWADRDSVFVNLNDSFLGISFEGQTKDQTSATAAQMHAGRLLTEQLRSRYGISAVNCVTHAQVSVNPANMGLGYHTDWAANFPFASFGLPDNYAVPSPALLLFGFRYDSSFVDATGPRMMMGIRTAEEIERGEALAARTTVAALRKQKEKKFKEFSEHFLAPENLMEGQ